MFEVFTLLLENIRLWEVALLLFLVWGLRNPDILKSIQSVKVGELEIKLRELEQEVSKSKAEIEELEEELESSRRMFGEILQGFDVNSADDLSQLAGLIKANARALNNLEELGDLLHADASPEEVYAAAVTLRERRPTGLFGDLIDYLEWIADDAELGENRLKAVWTLTSAAHRILLAAVRDGVQPGISRGHLQRAKKVLAKLERHPLVQQDRPDQPDKGIRGPIKHAQAWIEKGLANGA